MSLQYEASSTEEHDINEWWAEHQCPLVYKLLPGKAKVYIQFTPTGIGTGVIAVCSKCRQEKNCTDYSSW